MDKAKIIMAALLAAIIVIATLLRHKFSPKGKRAEKLSASQSEVYCAIAAVLLICSAIYAVLAITTAAPNDMGKVPPVLTSPYKELSEAFVEAADGFLLHLSEDVCCKG